MQLVLVKSCFFEQSAWCCGETCSMRRVAEYNSLRNSYVVCKTTETSQAIQKKTDGGRMRCWSGASSQIVGHSWQKWIVANRGAPASLGASTSSAPLPQHQRAGWRATPGPLLGSPRQLRVLQCVRKTKGRTDDAESNQSNSAPSIASSAIGKPLPQAI